ncbi:response regulator [Candidatus Wolfebacteria bacterium CG10_big_fil_rev_8_21_14_0_10_31_9]|uniref:Response regulator n=1 Tax=Candidatus Wolfebacteria bacterium CG10_big_fil_rev_8_21_14_0_10_31_9 TaxID=1975070 RepID=A0A2H0RBU0_9BACT|nr:MAG: response regulator [Candidatus Wolfebacteria bacterium CG10_big_fil_rev_8_21_14_0_10_31_9]
MKNILVVDDDANIRKILSVVLTDAGYRVVIAEDGETAMELLGYNFFDFVLTDLEMPGGISGEEVISAVKLKGISVEKIGLMSGQHNKGSKVANSHGVRFLSKPFNLRDVLDLVA